MTRRPRPKVRLFVDAALAPGGEIELTAARAHYLRRVMRLGPGDDVAAFNGADGEWSARLVPKGRAGARLAVEARLRAPAAAPDVVLAFAPIKRLRLDLLAEKATELGAARLAPVITRRTVPARVNLRRLTANAVEAAEQCGRLSVPAVTPPMPLADFVDALEAGRTLFWADEAGSGAPALDAFAARPGPVALLVGPEGGFDDDERARLGARPGAVAVGLGPRILRAETAALAMLALWQAARGDWRAGGRDATPPPAGSCQALD